MVTVNTVRASYLIETEKLRSAGPVTSVSRYHVCLCLRIAMTSSQTAGEVGFQAPVRDRF